MNNTEYFVDNIIGWIFEKVFNQLTFNGKELLEKSFNEINKKTFENTNIHKLINKLSGKSIDVISSYLSNKNYQEKFLFSKLKKQIQVQILLDNLPKIKSLNKIGHIIDKQCLQLAIINYRVEIVEYIIETCPNIKLDNELLIYCVGDGYENIYFYLRKFGLFPNISIYNRAVNGGSLSIVTDINEHIGISEKILENAFESNNVNIIMFLISVAIRDKVKINKNLVVYPILNNNMELLNVLEKNNFVDWHYELYYSALLSGSLEMIEYVESKMPEIHNKKLLDTSKTKKGQISSILTDIIYDHNGKKYFSHTINYAIQSKSLDVVKYVYSKGYGITVSNFITAIKQGTVEILDFLCCVYRKNLPFYLLHYFGMNSYVDEKFSKAKILLNSGLFNLLHDKLAIDDYKKETIHLQLINQTTQITEYQCNDPDFLMKYQMLFTEDINSKINYRLITKTRICLELDKEKELVDIFNTNYNEINKQYVIDTLFLFGNIAQIKKLYKLQKSLIVPSSQIIMEIICYCQIHKLCFLTQNNLLTKSIIDLIYPLTNALSDKHLSIFFEKICQNKPNIKHLLLSGNEQIILHWLNKNSVNELEVNKKILKNVLKLNNVLIAEKFTFPPHFLQELIQWTKDNDLLIVHNFLLSLLSNQNKIEK